MRYTWIGLIWLSGVLVATQVLAADVADLQITVKRPGATVKMDRVVEEGKLVVSVQEARA